MAEIGQRQRLLHLHYKKSTSENAAIDTLGAVGPSAYKKSDEVEMSMLTNLIRRWAVERRVNRKLRAYWLASSSAPSTTARSC
jgi:hypothetical protein